MAETLENQSAEEQAELLLTLRKGGVSNSSESDDFEDMSPLSALGLHRVGEALPMKESSAKLNRRGIPARIRKKNKNYFDDSMVNSPAQIKSPKRSSRGSTPKKSSSILSSPSSTASPTVVKIKNASTSITTPDKKIAQQNGLRLRNFLKLPQAHKWVYFEWFYSNIDKPLFEGENDFEIVLKEAFPQLATRKLTRIQWSLVRKLMGKPRRCSQAFFNEERDSLSKKREVLRLLQQRKINDINTLRDYPLPTNIPMQLVVGTKVTARIRKPENGLYTGVIGAVDTSDNTYRITFDRLGIGTHSIPDYEVLSNEGAEMMPLTSFSHQFRPRLPLGLITPPRPLLPKFDSELVNNLESPTSLTNDPVLAQSPIKSSKLSLEDVIGGFSVKSLSHITTLSKILKMKRTQLSILRDLNSQAEKMRSYGNEMTIDFQRKYASLVLDIEKMNRDLNQNLLSVQQFCQEIAPEAGLSGPTLLPGQIRERCYEEAAAIVEVTNNSSGVAQVSNASVLDLVAKLTSIMLQLKNMTESEVSAFELTSLQETVNDILIHLSEPNKSMFQNQVEVHLSHIMSTVSQIGTLQAFNSV